MMVALTAIPLQLELDLHWVPGIEVASSLDLKLCFQGPNQSSNAQRSWNTEIFGAGSKVHIQNPFPVLLSLKISMEVMMVCHFQLDMHEYPSHWSGAPKEQIIKDKENRLWANAKLNVQM